LFGTGEGIPSDETGQEMLPFAQFYLPTLGVSCPVLGVTNLLTLFISNEFPEQLEPMGKNWIIREYTSIAQVERRNYENPNSYLKPFPLKSEKIDEDYPLWDGGGVPPELESNIVELERAGAIGNYYDFTTHSYDHKFGGYPSFCQSGIDPGDGFEFVFQISSDAKINLNVVDNGSLMFWKNRESGEWALYYDFY
jgi:hypothetical protein